MAHKIALLAFIGVLAGGLWYTRPVLVWHWTVAPALELSDHPERVRPNHLQGDSRGSEQWARLRVGGFAARAPIRPDQGGVCSSCAHGCQLELEQGRLTIFEGSPRESHSEAVAYYAPAGEDVSVWRTRRENWRSVNALAGRALATYALPEVYRFDSAGSRGIVTRFDSGGVERFVIYAYPRGAGPGRTFALSRTGSDTLLQVLGGLEFGAANPRDGCSS